eukprot:Hpha_TRINITY_DN14627_c0_g1::TRINITY_DN14627_c0_g1_i1::g.48033::m.48033
MATYVSPARTGVSTIADHAHDHDRQFRQHPKFQKSHAVFASTSDRFKYKVGSAPCPTTYQAERQSKPQPPHHTFRSTTERAPLHNVASLKHPSPGKYEAKPTIGQGHGAAACFRSGVPRGVDHYKDVPDPTAYAPDRTQAEFSAKGGAGPAFASRTPRMMEPKHQAPPSNSYDHSALTIAGSARKHSGKETSQFRSRTAQTHTQTRGGRHDTPAPGHVTVRTGFDRAAEYKGRTTVAFASNQPRLHDKTTDTPPPGHYDPQGGSSRHGAVSVFRSTSPRVIHGTKPHGSGPAVSYAAEANTIAARSRSATPSHHFRSGTERFKPARAKHNAEAVLTPDFTSHLAKRPTGRAGFVSNEPRFITRENAVPGPGQYSREQEAPASNPHFSFQSRTPRLADRGRSHTPGPGSYQAQAVQGKGDGTRPESPAATFRSGVYRTGLEDRKGTPGPGHYHSSEKKNFGADAHASTKPSRPKGVAFGALGEERFRTQQSDTPGPGHCVTQYSSFLE